MLYSRYLVVCLAAGPIAPLVPSLAPSSAQAQEKSSESGCGGVASAPFVDRRDLAAIERASAKLPEARKAVPTNVGSVVGKAVARAPIPAAVVKVLPQYRGYRALRSGRMLVIVDPYHGRIVYLLPLGGATSRGPCP